ncbi:DotD/TraH family lipoprotein [Gluconobacter kondonii]|uniref:DotD/TraH family lipoprotein n=1 Tax=Gluconobacter TaxID=441 RepID=UPI000C0683A0|nr:MULTISPECIES: DotD/TraH family lipoprotein [Gluconobacter]MBS1023070.1 DotD/TraH family lipoprotein [Gluconobacter cerinus]MBS1025419.1 DotD/TraH family lipoprotein [Gluconobacter cerinus]MBS1054818.1 DotD/TraH family lipoprotein [Gluconobacter kondonii]MBS1078118.1 DotD/TraH family lipoprotein [Gluconobacter kondonii]MBS1092417.1 DotD/TraH family lipoprotein [Gluconobacter sp. Dm-74]
MWQNPLCRPFGLTLLLLSGLCACSEQPRPPVRPFDQDMNHILSALDQIGALRFPLVRAGSVLPAEMNRPVSWHWQGPLDEGIRLIARRVGYETEIPPCPAPPIIAVDQQATTFGRLLDEMASASSGHADIWVDIPHHVIRITWNA